MEYQNVQVLNGRKEGQTHCELTLGTAQLGMNYGVANTVGKPTAEQAFNILNSAFSMGIMAFDTARCYGEAEHRLGITFPKHINTSIRIITKLSPLNELNAHSTLEHIQRSVDQSIEASCHALNASTLDTVLLHRSEHRYLYNGAIWDRVLYWKQQGKIKNLGFSVYYPDEVVQLLSDTEDNIDLVQIPFNVLDTRWFSEEFQLILNSNSHVAIYARSVLLQGILANDDAKWPSVISDKLKLNIVAQLDSYVKKFNQENRKALCIAYARSIPWIDSLVIGIDSLEQLEEVVSLFQKDKLSSVQIREIQSTFQDIPEQLLNPAQWES